MTNRMRLIVPLALSVLLTFAVSACSGLARQLDVVGRESVASFDALLKAAPENVAADDMNGGWSFAAPDGTAKFIWSRDYSKSPLHDVMLELDAQPFLDAGLNVNALPENVEYYDGKLTVGTKLGDDELEYISEATPLSSYEHLVEIYRGVIGYHAALDHYGVSLGGGNLFEWAKDTGANDKDVVFVLEPELWIAAGTDPNNIDGWVFAKVTVDVDGKPAEVDKILKAFDLER